MPSPKKSRLEELHAEIAESLAIAEEATDLRAQAAVLKTEIAAEQKRYEAIAAKVKQAQAEYDTQASEHTETLQRLTLDTDAMRQSLRELEQRAAVVTQLLSDAKNELTNTNAAISDAKIAQQAQARENETQLNDYRRQQEQLESTVMQTQDQVNELMAELQRQAYTKQMNQEAIEAGQRTLFDQASVHTSAARQHKLDLGALEIEIANKRNLMLSFDAEMNRRKQEMEQREEAVNVRLTTMEAQNADLTARERKLRLDERLTRL